MQRYRLQFILLITSILFAVKSYAGVDPVKVVIYGDAHYPPYSWEQGFLGYSNIRNDLFPYKNEFVLEFDTIIEQMKSSGKIDAIVEQFYRDNQPKPIPAVAPDFAP